MKMVSLVTLYECFVWTHVLQINTVQVCWVLNVYTFQLCVLCRAAVLCVKNVEVNCEQIMEVVGCSVYRTPIPICETLKGLPWLFLVGWVSSTFPLRVGYAQWKVPSSLTSFPDSFLPTFSESGIGYVETGECCNVCYVQHCCTLSRDTISHHITRVYFYMEKETLCPSLSLSSCSCLLKSQLSAKVHICKWVASMLKWAFKYNVMLKSKVIDLHQQT